MKEEKILTGFGIVVLERGLIYVGNIVMDNKFCIIHNAKNIRYWGTTKGLGQLALSGPTEKTKLDDTGIVRAPLHSVIHTIDSEGSLWKK